jgi:hypothetical protein
LVGLAGYSVTPAIGRLLPRSTCTHLVVSGLVAMAEWKPWLAATEVVMPSTRFDRDQPQHAVSSDAVTGRRKAILTGPETGECTGTRAHELSSYAAPSHPLGSLRASQLSP